MHRAHERIKNAVGIIDKNRYRDYNFSEILKSRLISDANQDAVDYAYNSIFSFFSACSSIERGDFSWSIVKLYYSTFYGVRAILALNGFAIGYCGHSPFSIDISKNAIAMRKGNTHEVVFHVFKEYLPNSMLIGEIEGLNAFQWLKEKRELVHYKQGAFQEPVVPLFLPFSTLNQMISSLELYFRSTDGIYSFDKDHAIFSYPIAILRSLKNNLKRSGNHISSEKIDYLKSFSSKFQLYEAM